MNRIDRIIMNSQTHARSKIRLVDDLLKHATVPLSGRALEVGCGAGFSSAHIARQYGLGVVGTDVEVDTIETATKKNGRIDRLIFLTADATALPFEDESFDMVLSQNVFHHIPGWKAAAKEVARVIRPGGLFLFSDMSRPGTLTRLLLGLETDHGFHEVEELITLMGIYGLKAIKCMEPEGRFRKKFAFLFKKEWGLRRFNNDNQRG